MLTVSGNIFLTSKYGFKPINMSLELLDTDIYKNKMKDKTTYHPWYQRASVLIEETSI